MYRFFDYQGDERLTGCDLAVFTIICCNQEYCSKSAPKIGQLARFGTRSVFRSLERLEQLALIKIEKTTKRTWKIWPLIPKHTATLAVTQNGHTANLTKHTAKAHSNILPHRQANSIRTVKEQDDLKIDGETTREQMRKFGINLDLKTM